MLKNIKFVGKIVSEPTITENGDIKFLLSFNRRCITDLNTMEHRREVAEVIVKNAPSFREQLIKNCRLAIQGELSLTNQFLDGHWSTPVLTLTMNAENDLHFVVTYGLHKKLGQ